MAKFELLSLKSIFIFHLLEDKDGFLLELKKQLGSLDIIGMPLDDIIPKTEHSLFKTEHS